MGFEMTRWDLGRPIGIWGVPLGIWGSPSGFGVPDRDLRDPVGNGGAPLRFWGVSLGFEAPRCGLDCAPLGFGASSHRR